MIKFFSSASFQLLNVLAMIRIIVGLLLMYHGFEFVDPKIMARYLSWEIFSGTYGHIWVYIGKSSELISGSLLVLGLFTRGGAILIIGTFTFITFILGKGRIWYEEQNSFLLILFGVLFLFAGPCAWSLDQKFFGKK